MTLALLVFLILAAFWKVAFLRGALYYHDITTYSVPLRHFYGRAIREGRLPLWTTHLYGGFPIFADGQAGPLYPPNLALFPWMPTWIALNLSTVGHMVGLALFTYVFLRRMASRTGALVGALVMTFNAFVIEHNIHTNFLNQLTWLPLLLWVADHGFEGGDARWFVGGALIVACQVLAGNQQVAMYSALVVSGYAATLVFGRGRGFVWGLRRLACGMALMYGLGAALAAIQVLPTFELLSNSVRASGLSPKFASRGSWAPGLFPTYFFPAAFGSRMHATAWLSSRSLPACEITPYAGIVALVLAAHGAVHARGRRPTYFLGVGLFAVLLTLGSYSLLWRPVQFIPLLKGFRVPARWSALASLAIAVLAAQGLDALCHDRERRASLWPAAAVALAAGMALALVLWCYGVTGIFRPVPPDADAVACRLMREVRADLAVRLLLLAGGIAVTALAIQFRAWGWLCACAFSVLVVLDGWSFAAGRIPTISPEYWTAPSHAVPLLRKHQGVHRMRQWRIPDQVLFAFKWPGWAEDNSIHYHGLEALCPNLPLMYGINAAYGDLPLTLKRWAASSARSDLVRGRLAPFYLVLTSESLPAGEWRQLKRGVVKLFAAKQAPPRTWVVHQIACTSHFDRARDATRAWVKDPLRQAVVEMPSGHPAPTVKDATGPEEAEIVHYEAEEMTVRARASAPGLLVVTDPYYPGWHAWVDGRPADIFPTNVLFRGVFVDAGEHTVRFRYQPASVVSQKSLDI